MEYDGKRKEKVLLITVIIICIIGLLSLLGVLVSSHSDVVRLREEAIATSYSCERWKDEADAEYARLEEEFNLLSGSYAEMREMYYEAIRRENVSYYHIAVEESETFEQCFDTIYYGTLASYSDVIESCAAAYDVEEVF